MKHLLRGVLVIISSFVASYFFEWDTSSSFFNTIFTVDGIFFSIGYSIIISFDLSQVTNLTVLKSIKDNLKELERNFLGYFTVATIAFLTSDLEFVLLEKYTKINWGVLCGASSILVLVYFVLNYRRLQHLKDSVTDRIREQNTYSDADSI